MLTFQHNLYFCPSANLRGAAVTSVVRYERGFIKNKFTLFFLCRFRQFISTLFLQNTYRADYQKRLAFDSYNYRTTFLFFLFFILIVQTTTVHFNELYNRTVFTSICKSSPSCVISGHTNCAGNLVTCRPKIFYTMKQIKLVGIARETNGIYSVYLGNKTHHTFSSRKKAQRFLSVTNQFLTKKLYEIRAIYIEAWIKYQNNWGYFEHDKPTMCAQLRQMQRGCEEIFKTCEDHFNIIIERDDWTNGNYFAFRNLHTVCANLKDAVIMLNRITRKRSSTFELYAFDNLFVRICGVEKEIKEYSSPGAQWYFKSAMHLEDPTHINIPKPAFA